jgi:hypothetical protein
MRAIAAWKIQNGTTVGLIEQLLGSNNITGALTTQIQLRALNALGIFIVVLWCLSPVGSQASLRVVSVVPSYPHSTTPLTAMDTFAEYIYGGPNGYSEASTKVRSPFTASLLSASLLKTRNQDLWENIRLPSIEGLSNDGNPSWVNISFGAEVQYPSLVGVPVRNIPSSNAINATFILSGSYLNVTCGILEPQADFTNFTASNVTAPGGKTDCAWYSSQIGQLQIAISESCGVEPELNGTVRDARKFIWESGSQNGILGSNITHAECELYTTYVDVNMLCVGNTCSPTAVRRNPQPPRDRNFTVFDFGEGLYDTNGFATLFTNMFPGSSISGGNPTIFYCVDPYHAITSQNFTDIYDIGKPNFEMCLAQMLNTQLVLGIDTPSVTGNFNPPSNTSFGTPLKTMDIIGTSNTEQDIVRCNRGWLAVLLLSSITLFVVGFIAAVLRLVTLVRDVLGTLSFAMLENRCQNLEGSSAWTGAERAMRMRDVKVILGDVHPESEVGQIALAAPGEGTAVSMVQRGRMYK